MTPTEPTPTPGDVIAQTLRDMYPDSITSTTESGVNEIYCRESGAVLTALAAAGFTITRAEAGTVTARMIEELEDAHSRLCDTHGIFGEGPETERQRGFYRAVKARVIAAAVPDTRPEAGTVTIPLNQAKGMLRTLQWAAINMPHKAPPGNAAHALAMSNAIAAAAPDTGEDGGTANE